MNAIDPSNNLESAQLPEVKVSAKDPEFIYKFNNTEFPEKYAVLSFISPADVYKSFDSFTSHAFLKDYVNTKLKNALSLALTHNESKYREILTKYIHDLETMRDNEISNEVTNEVSNEVTNEEANSNTESKSETSENINKLIKLVQESIDTICITDPNDSVITSYAKDLDISFDQFNTEYQSYVESNRTKLNECFEKLNNVKSPSVCAVKVLGVFESVEKAQEYAKNKFIPNNPYNNMFIGEVGAWHAWSSDYTECENTVYMNESLQKLMDSYKENMKKHNDDFNERRKAALEHNKQDKAEQLKQKYLNKTKE